MDTQKSIYHPCKALLFSQEEIQNAENAGLGEIEMGYGKWLGYTLRLDTVVDAYEFYDNKDNVVGTKVFTDMGRELIIDTPHEELQERLIQISGWETLLQEYKN